ncbi:maleylpyruvate isomerase family mycothiol-dependent enzyme [Pseudonocardia oroxyli]|uniref:TIGR03083 family protein n=1 Tax=Pseudonocardia oroxyli TaxID=366584 RepID=A0A1G7MVK3_PSEOR|nr:maleylpyruvate isomerase family mycothiol-dependent enzyme [Pseudonocardia oroxyli]SDF65764.1 TIGR03083 family protein [Pseudonocardia oroxyli]
MTAPAPTSARRAALDHETAMDLAAAEYARGLDLFGGLGSDDWARPTDCPGWDVRDMASHMLGMAECGASLPRFAGEFALSLWAQHRAGGNSTDHMTARQVARRGGMAPAEIVERYAAAGPRAAAGRRRRPAALRAMPVGGVELPGGAREPWTMGFLLDTILTRDSWMHRVDIARATGREPVLTAAHDGVLVADVVTEWAGRHGAPCTLVLTGPAGGRWEFGGGGEPLELDAVEFCRALSLRERGTGLLATEVPF